MYSSHMYVYIEDTEKAIDIFKTNMFDSIKMYMLCVRECGFQRAFFIQNIATFNTSNK